MSLPYPVQKGEVDFDVEGAGKPCKTTGCILDGGPGVAHNYLLPIQDLALPEYGSRAVIMYDQLGCGRSTHLPHMNGNTGFWTVGLFLRELENLLEKLGVEDYDLLGQSWGGMLGSEHAIRQPKGLNKLIISNSPASMELWVEAAGKLREGLPLDVQKTLLEHEEAGTTDSPEYEQAMGVFYAKHLCRIQPEPQELLDSFAQLKADNTVYLTMNGPSEFYITGSLRTWSVIEKLGSIKVSTLLINGKYDEAQDSVVQPFFEGIEKVKWAKFDESSHFPHFEEKEGYLKAVREFLD